MFNKISLPTFLATAFAAVLLFTLGATTPVPSFSSAPDGLASTVATSSSRTWTVASQLAFATSTDCTSRVIGTREDAIRIVFSDRIGERPTASIGFPQAASTTVAYDSGIYGCGAVYIYSYAAQVINLAETR